MAQKPEHLGGDRWRVRVYVGTDPATGRKIQRSRTFRAKGPREANKIALGLWSELAQEVEDARALKGTIAELVATYEAHQLARADWSPAHAHRQHGILATIAADLGRIRCADLTGRHVDGWYTTLLGRGLAPRTVHHCNATLRAMLRQGAKWGMASDTPVRMATLPKVRAVEVQPPTNAAVAALLGTATGALRVALAVAAYTGCRRGEILGLRWGDFEGRRVNVRRSVSEVDGTMYVKAPKSGKGRTFTVDDGLLELLGDWRGKEAARIVALGREVPADWFVLADLRADASGQTPRRPGWLSLAWSRHRGDADVRLHDLRHWHLSTLAAGGVPMVTVQARGGHADISTTGIYSHALPEGEATTTGVIQRALQERNT